MQNTVSLKVEAPLACFTRPEAKVERVSYMCMTPAAARGVLESIVWKPQFEWVIHKIVVLKPIRFISIRRNEIQHTIPVNGPHGVEKWMKKPETFVPYFTDQQRLKDKGKVALHGNRVQRHTLALRDVAYFITAEPRLTPKANLARTKPPDAEDPPGLDTVEKYLAMFNRRVSKGQCFQQPYLGLREFVANFKSGGGEGAAPRFDEADSVLGSDEYPLGYMFFDFDYSHGPPRPLFAQANLRRGVLNVDEMRASLSTSSAEGGTA